MGIYLDIDLDFLVKPVMQKSINGVRLYKHGKCQVDDAEAFVQMMNKKISGETFDKKFFTNHRKSYTYWWIKNLKDMTLVHIDAHSDLYRNRERDLRYLSDTDMSCDDYIWYAIRDGYISKIFWVIPEGLYDLSDVSLAERFISKDMLREYRYEDGMLKISFSVITRHGEKIIDYTICDLNTLPEFQSVELLTTATSPEFTPEASDEEISKALSMLGADRDEVERIMKMHSEMPEK